MKHVELRYAFLQHLVQQKRLRVHFVRGLDNPADALTKSAKTTPMLDHLCAEAGLVQLTNTGAAVIQAVREVDVSAADGGEWISIRLRFRWFARRRESLSR